MNFEILKRSHLKRNIAITLIVIAIISTIILSFTKAKYRVTLSIPLVNGTINYSLADLNVIAIYINSDSGYTKTDIIPESGYALNEEESYCTIDGNKDDTISLSYDVDTKSLSVTPFTTKGTKCYLYFDEYNPNAAKEYILSHYDVVLTRNNFSTTVTNTTTGTIYKSVNSTQYDNDGEVYYFAGNPTDNWVQFGGFYWRIIRINGNGSVRIIYSGNKSTGTVTTGSGTQLSSTSTFYSSSTDNAYVGFKYTVGRLHGTGSNSTIVTALNNWYTSSGLSSYADKLDGNVGFCGDREPSTSSTTSNGSGGVGTTSTYYGAYIRLVARKVPSFKCENDSDLYTTSESSNGNKSLTYPIGLITSDEVAYAGGVWSTSNTSYYLYTGQYYWTMSPCYYPSSLIFIVDSDGLLFDGGYYWTNTFGVRPVVNLKANVHFSSGNGTASNPYVVS